MFTHMKGSLFRSLPWRGQTITIRTYSSSCTSLHQELTSRRIPLMFDYLHPQPSHLLNLTLIDLFPDISCLEKNYITLPSITEPSPLPPGHHLIYFPPQVTLSQLLPDGTDTLHTPGKPFDRRLWAGGSVRFSDTNSLSLDGSRAVCIEGIRDVIVKGQEGHEKIIVRIQRQMGTVSESENESSIKSRLWPDQDDEQGHAAVVETRDLVFMREKTASQLELDKIQFEADPRIIKSPTNPEFRHRITPTTALLFRFSALTFNAHSIHLDKSYTQNAEGYRNLLVHGPLTLTLLLTALRGHLTGLGLTIKEIEYKNLSPLYVEDEMAICGKQKPGKNNAAWDVWIENKHGGLAVRGTAQVGRSK